MSVKEQLKKEAQTEKEKLKNMSFQDKIWYIREYYKMHILGVFIVIGILWVIGNSIYRSTFKTELYCMIINNPSEQELNTDILTDGFHAYMGFNEKQVIQTESISISYNDRATEYTYASMAKISALVASRDLDIMISDQTNFDHYASLNGFSDLEEELPPDLLELVRDRIIYGKDEAGVSRAYGISLNGTPFAAKSNLFMEPAIFCVLNNSNRKDNSFALLRYIFAQ